MANGGRGNNYVSVANEWVWQFVCVAHWLMRVGVERFSFIYTYLKAGIFGDVKI